MVVEPAEPLGDGLPHVPRPALEALRAALATGTPPPGITLASLTALLDIAAGVLDAAVEDNADLSPSEAAVLLGMARPSVMRLIARGELASRKEGGHYLLSPRDLRAFQKRLGAIRREALAALTGMADEFGF